MVSEQPVGYDVISDIDLNELNPFGLLVMAKTRIGGKTLYGLPIVKKDEIKSVAIELGEPPSRRAVIGAELSVSMQMVEDAEFNTIQYVKNALGQVADFATQREAKEREYPRYTVDYNAAEYCVIWEDDDNDLNRIDLDEFLKAPFATDKEQNSVRIFGYFPVQFFL